MIRGPSGAGAVAEAAIIGYCFAIGHRWFLHSLSNMKKSEIEIASWYDHPEWFEIGFENETKKEANFFEKAFKKYCPFQVKRLLEPACGGGRLVVEMASRGYDVTGFDLSQAMLDHTRKELKKRNLKAKTLIGDMTDFSFPKKFDSAFCTFNSFRQLLSEEAAQSFLRCVAGSLRPGGLFFLGLHLAPMDVEPLGTERWVGRRGKTQVTTTLRVTASSRKTRLEHLRISVLVRELERGTYSNGKPSANGNGKRVKVSNDRPSAAGKIVGRLRDEFDYRLYTAAQLKRTFASVPDLNLVGVFDFWYDMNDPQKFDDDLIDGLFVFQRR